MPQPCLSLWPTVGARALQLKKPRAPHAAGLLALVLAASCGKPADPENTRAEPSKPEAAAPPTGMAELPVVPTTTAATVAAWQPPPTLAHWTSQDGVERALTADAVRPLLDPDLRGPEAIQQLAWRTAATLWLTRELLQNQLGDSERAQIDGAARMALLEETSRTGSAEAWMRTQQRAGKTVEARRAEVWVEAALTAAVIRQGEPALDEKLIIERWTKRAGRFAIPAQATAAIFAAQPNLPAAEAKRRLTDALAAMSAGQDAEQAAASNDLILERFDGDAHKLSRSLEQAILQSSSAKPTAIVETDFGWQAAWCYRVQPTQVLPLASARPKVEEDLRRELRVLARRKLQRDLMIAAKVQWQIPPGADGASLPGQPSPTR